MNILLVEDNEMIIKGLVFSFEKSDYKLEYKTSIIDTKNYLLNNKPDLIILDVTLPDGNGFDFYKMSLKEKEIPVIFLTALDDENDIVNGLELGADDYITKPFSTKELMARINKILLRKIKKNIIKVNDLTFDLDSLVLTKNGKMLELSPLELKIITLLFTNKGSVITRDTLLDKVYDWTGNYIDDHTITVYFKRIREKLGEDSIKTVKGIGYRINEE
ncbi:MAG: response regulator transcription factor [Bacilli bacterium]|nr:response regulator transcription factor [Bacilli bacterium]